MNLRGRSLTQVTDLTRAEFLYVTDLARRLRENKLRGGAGDRLAGRNIALIFEKTSTRTRSAFEVAAHDEGAHVSYLGPGETQLGNKESVRDTARVLADILTVTDHCGKPLPEVPLCYLGDGRNNTASSLLVTGALLGMDIRICAPPLFQPSGEVRRAGQRLARDSGARVTVTGDVAEAVAAADFLYTDVWLSSSTICTGSGDGTTRRQAGPSGRTLQPRWAASRRAVASS